MPAATRPSPVAISISKAALEKSTPGLAREPRFLPVQKSRQTKLRRKRSRNVGVLEDQGDRRGGKGLGPNVRILDEAEKNRKLIKDLGAPRHEHAERRKGPAIEARGRRTRPKDGLTKHVPRQGSAVQRRSADVLPPNWARKAETSGEASLKQLKTGSQAEDISDSCSLKFAVGGAASSEARRATAPCGGGVRLIHLRHWPSLERIRETHCFRRKARSSRREASNSQENRASGELTMGKSGSTERVERSKRCRWEGRT